MPDSCTSAMMYNRPAALKMLAAWDTHSRTQVFHSDILRNHPEAPFIPGGLDLSSQGALFDWAMHDLLSQGVVQWDARSWVNVSPESLKASTFGSGYHPPERRV